MNAPYRCWAEVDLDALRSNLAWLRHRVGPHTRILTVVKADAYGHGLKQIAALLMQSGTDIFGVANLAEARSVRLVGRGWPVLMLGACLPEEIPAAVSDGIMPTLSTLAEARAFAREAQRQNKTVDVHLKVDTGMGRLGARPEEAAQLARAMSRLPGVRLTGLMTHFSSAEDDAAFTRQQKERFAAVLKAIEAMGIVVPFIHACNSSGLLFEPDALYNLVRPGLLVYGVIPPGKRKPATALAQHLKPALQWKSRVTLVREVPKNTPLSYGHKYVTPRPMRVAVIGCGYGDGYMRAASQRAAVLVGGKLCRVLGRVTMDQTLVDVTALARVKPGAEVVLLGRQGQQEITAGQLAEWFGTISWEVLTNISYRVPRVYRGGQAA